jgi:sugar lactone lactonase YvrE
MGFADGQGISASFHSPNGVAVDAGGNVYVADLGNHGIRKIAPSGSVSTLAGSGSMGFADGQGISARFNYPHGVCVDTGGNVYVADRENHRIRKITPSGSVSTLAGSGIQFADGQGTSASFSYPSGVTVDAGGIVYVADSGNERIRKITPSGDVSTLAGSGNHASADGQGTAASFHWPIRVAVDAGGNVYVADNNSNLIRKITISQ